MKAVIETKNDLYLIRIYGSDGLPCDTYVVENIFYSEEGRRINDLFKRFFEEVRK